MRKRKLPFNAQKHPSPEGGNVIDSIMIQPWSMGRLNAGQFSKGNPPNGISVKISATNKNRVEYEEKMLGSEEYYTLVYEVSNFNDSPAFAFIEKT